MTSEWVTRLAGELLWTGFLVSVPLIGLTTAVGVLASILQVVTQVSEAALSFVPKLVAAGLALVLFGPWMLDMLVRFTFQLWSRIPQVV